MEVVPLDLGSHTSSAAEQLCGPEEGIEIISLRSQACMLSTIAAPVPWLPRY